MIGEWCVHKVTVIKRKFRIKEIVVGESQPHSSHIICLKHKIETINTPA